MTELKDQQKKWAKIVAKSWADEDYKKRLLSMPMEILKKEGMELPSGLEVRVVENTDNVYYLVLPEKPSESEISAEEGDSLIAAYNPVGV